VKTLRARRVETPLGERKLSILRMRPIVAWAGLGVLGLAAIAQALARSRRTPATDEAVDGEEPDVLLDVRDLSVDRISLEVEDLRAHVAVLAELANLVRLSVGVDARLDRVKLEIEGVEAKVILKVRLEHIRAILEKALDTIAENPEILRILSRSLSALIRQSLTEAQTTLTGLLDGLQVGDTVDEALRGKLEAISATLAEILERPEIENGGGEAPTPRTLAEGSTDDTAGSAAE
jgi:hypothetical protein